MILIWYVQSSLLSLNFNYIGGHSTFYVFSYQKIPSMYVCGFYIDITND